MSAEKGHKDLLEYISLSEASQQSGYTPEYLNSLARQGKLKAKKIGRNWHTTLAWLDDFIQTTKTAKKEKIDKLDAIIHKYTSGKAEIPEEKPIQDAGSDRAGLKTEKKDLSIAEALSEKTEIKFQSRWKIANSFTATLVAVFLLLGIFQLGRFIKSNNFEGERLFKNHSNDYPADGEYPRWISEDGIVEGEETANTFTEPRTGPSLASENYQIKEIKFGGAIAMASAQENPNLEISDVRSEVMKTKGKEEDQLLIRWRTNRLALSTIEYSTMNGSNPRKLIEDSYGFNHSIVLANLEPGTAYIYSVKGKDRWANEVSSDRYSAYTGSKIISVFDLIVNAIKEVFGWAVKE
jgi:hypothetical protein